MSSRPGHGFSYIVNQSLPESLPDYVRRTARQESGDEERGLLELDPAASACWIADVSQHRVAGSQGGLLTPIQRDRGTKRKMNTQHACVPRDGSLNPLHSGAAVNHIGIMRGLVGRRCRQAPPIHRQPSSDCSSADTRSMGRSGLPMPRRRDGQKFSMLAVDSAVSDDHRRLLSGVRVRWEPNGRTSALVVLGRL